jgi:hypothetical protein
LNQFDGHKNSNFARSYQLFGFKVQVEFPISPNAFVSFVDSISDKINQIFDKSNMDEKDITKIESIILSNSLVVFNKENERRALLNKNYFINE